QDDNPRPRPGAAATVFDGRPLLLRPRLLDAVAQLRPADVFCLGPPRGVLWNDARLPAHPTAGALGRCLGAAHGGGRRLFGVHIRDGPSDAEAIRRAMASAV